jgi:ABC-2 type transport system permease protein
MQKIWLIIQREYLTRVRKPSFIIMSILGPVLVALLMIVPIWLATQGGDTKTIQVIDESGYLEGKFPPLDKINFIYNKMPLPEAKASLKKSGFDGVLYIPKIDLANQKPEGIELYSEKSFSIVTQKVIESTIRKELENIKLESAGIDKVTLAATKTTISIKTISIREEGEKADSSAALTGIGYFSGFLIYMFIFLYGVQVMRGVLEEKSNRIIEVMISSVKPFQLMMGKILGIGCVALTQFLIWTTLSIAVSTAISVIFKLDRFSQDQISTTLSQMQNTKDIQQTMDMYQIYQQIDSINLPFILACFAFYFLGGYFMYAALFAAAGAAADNETDTQQFMLPVSMPLILSIVLVSAVITDPNSKLAFWASMFPLTSPIIMMVRVPFIGFSWEILLSMAFLIAGFFGAVWLAARIYRVGILMYGKKISYKDLKKWLFM